MESRESCAWEPAAAVAILAGSVGSPFAAQLDSVVVVAAAVVVVAAAAVVLALEPHVGLAVAAVEPHVGLAACC